MVKVPVTGVPKNGGSIVTESPTVIVPVSSPRAGYSGSVTAESRRQLPAPLSCASARPSTYAGTAIELRLSDPPSVVVSAVMVGDQSTS